MTDAAEKGPGHTRWSVGEDGCIYQHRWNDDGRVTRFAHLEELRASTITRLLREAYLAGFEDRATLVRDALGISK